LKKYCTQEHVELNANNYNDMFKFIQGFFDITDNEKHFIDYADSTREDKMRMLNYYAELVESLKKQDPPLTLADTKEICTYKEKDENAQNMKQSENECANPSLHILHIFKSELKPFLDEKKIDIEIACDTYEFLIKNDEGTLQDIVNYIHETVDPDDFNNETTPLKIDNHLNRMFMQDLLDFNGNKYELTDAFMSRVISASNKHKGGERVC